MYRIKILLKCFYVIIVIVSYKCFITFINNIERTDFLLFIVINNYIMPDSHFHVDNDDVFAGLLFVVAIITFLLYLLIYLL